jgi:hypothetical protein
MRGHKFFIWSLLASALFIAGNAAFFSIKGIALLFSGSLIPVAIMASSLEIGKLFTTSFLYRYWNDCTKSLKAYLSIALLLLIGITSLGIYGYLANAFEYTRTQVELYDTQIKQLQEENLKIQQQIDGTDESGNTSDIKIEDAIAGYERIYNDYVEQQTTKRTNAKTDYEAVNQTVVQEREMLHKRLKELDSIIEAIKSKKGLFTNTKKDLEEEQTKQKPERDKITTALEQLQLKEQENLKRYNDTITNIDQLVEVEYNAFIEKVNDLRSKTSTNEEDAQQKISQLYTTIKDNESKILSIRHSVQNTDIGTFKFVARAFGVETDTSVKWFTIAIVLVFDPLAICLIIGFNAAHVKMYGTSIPINSSEIISKEDYVKARRARKQSLKSK